MKLVFATHNEHKFIEVQLLLPEHITLLSLHDIGCSQDIPETAETLEGNAILKADYVTDNYGYPCFADDTGLLVDALEGAPGVRSARYAGEQKSSQENMDKLLAKLKNKTSRSAQFKTVIALNLNGKKTLFQGIVKGEITKSKQGEKGFGYDPIFSPRGYNKTFAELSISIKNKISHRGRAIRELTDYLKKQRYATE
ncbi:MAG: non-canonical purine NTP diphosphatase [Saonia sp.]